MLKPILSFTIAVCILSISIPIGAQVKRPAAPPRPAIPAKARPAVKNFDPNTVEQIEMKDSANGFAEKGLPEPEDFGGPPSDRFASAIARRISNYDEDTLPLLITALQRTGFHIINRDRKTIYQPTTGSGMGLAFFDWEVAGMYKLSRRGVVSSINKIAAQMGKNSPELPPSRIADLMVQDLRRSANSNNKLVRSWAKLIIEFGRNMPTPVDLTLGDVKDAPLNVIQASLWERRLIGDIVAYAQSSALVRPHKQPSDSSFQKVLFLKSYPMADCQVNDVEGLIMDGASLGLTTGNGMLINQIQAISSQGTANTIGKVATGLGVANIVLSWAKLAAAMMTLKGEVKIADPMPLERTKNNIEGDERMMTARVWADVGNLSYLNCVRLALNASSGLDFSMPNDGPLSDRDISWELKGAASFAGQGSSKTGKFDNFVNLKAPEDVVQRDPMKQITDSNGQSKMRLVGAPKIPSVLNKPVVPVNKRAGIAVSVSFKSSRDKAQNFLDMGSAALSVALSGPVAILSILPEIGYRTKWEAKRITAPVTDWELCTDDWAGAVRYERLHEFTERVNNASRIGTRRVKEFAQITWEMVPRTRDMPANTPPRPANVTVVIDNSDIFEGTGLADVCCNDKAIVESGARVRDAITVTANNTAKSILPIDLNEAFLLSITPAVGDVNAFKATRRRSFTVSESKCPVDEEPDAETVDEITAYFPLIALDRTKTQRKLTKQENGLEQIFGSETFDSPGGGEITYTWFLARCGD